MHTLIRKIGIPVCILLAVFAGNRTAAQTGSLDTVRVYAIISANGDTIPYGVLPPVFVYTKYQ